MSDAFNAPMGGFSGDMSPGGPPAQFGPRLVARLIDIGLMIAMVIPVVIVATVLGAISDILGLLIGFVLYFAILAAGIYIIVGGQALTGQSPGQRMQGVKIVTDGGQLLGWGPAIIRWLVGGVFNSVLCGLPIGSLWMLWDGEKKTLYDKVLNNQAVTVPKGSITPIFPGGSPF